jgi:3-oxoacyl-[acyl-carrier-protein] synthase-3
MGVRTTILGTGHYVPDRVVTNRDLEKMMDTTDEWIQQRTGIQERRWITAECGASDLAKLAADRALEMAGLVAKDIDAIVFATLSPDYNFPGSGCLLNALMGIPGTPSLDIRNQCSGFVYGTQIADAWIRSGMYKRVLFIGAEVHSTGLDLTSRGRDVSVLFGDGAGAVIYAAAPDSASEEVGVLATTAGADGNFAKDLWLELPASRYIPRITKEGFDEARHFPRMNGREVFKTAVRKLPEAVHEVLRQAGKTLAEMDLFIPHQANLRISEAVQKALGLPDEKVYNNIMRYGNTTAASIPIALDECIRSGRLKRGQLVVAGAFGAGFTWGATAIRL